MSLAQTNFTSSNLALPEKLAFGSFLDPPNFVWRVIEVAIIEKSLKNRQNRPENWLPGDVKDNSTTSA